MPRWLKRKCKICGSSEKKLSRAGYCIDCAVARCAEVGKQIKNRKGEYYEKYKKGISKYLGFETKKNSEETVSSDGNP